MSSVSSSQLYKFTVNTDYVVVVKLCIQLRSQRLLQILPTFSQLRLKTQAREYMLSCTVCRWIGYSSNAVCHLPSMLLCFGHRKEHPACTSWVMRSWHGCLSWMRCRFFCIMSNQCYCHPKTPSPLASFISRLVSPFWYWLTQVLLEKVAVKWVFLPKLHAPVVRCWVLTLCHEVYCG